jgi:hypothetical protein
MKKKLLTAAISFFSFLALWAQPDDGLLYSKDGQSLGPKRAFTTLCKEVYGAPADNPVVTKICACQTDLLNGRFTMKQIKAYEKQYSGRGFFILMEEDSLFQQDLKQCQAGAENMLLLDLPAYRSSFVTKCIENLKMKSTQPLSDSLAAGYCNCAADVMEKRKVTLDRMDELMDPASFLFNEIAYRCSNPFLSPTAAPTWAATTNTDFKGALSTDTVQLISVLGMHKVKVTIGGTTKIWMLDSGASDLLVSDDYAKELREIGVLSDLNYIGEGTYSLADNSTLRCKRYRINGLKIGRFEVNNVVLAASRQTKQFLLGKSVLNKFSEWTLDNRNERLILKK